jgi:hypothetical protein
VIAWNKKRNTGNYSHIATLSILSCDDERHRDVAPAGRNHGVVAVTLETVVACVKSSVVRVTPCSAGDGRWARLVVVARLISKGGCTSARTVTAISRKSIGSITGSGLNGHPGTTGSGTTREFTPRAPNEIYKEKTMCKET